MSTLFPYVLYLNLVAKHKKYLQYKRNYHRKTTASVSLLQQESSVNYTAILFQKAFLLNLSLPSEFYILVAFLVSMANSSFMFTGFLEI